MMGGKALRTLWWLTASLAVAIFMASIPAYFLEFRQAIAGQSNPVARAVWLGLVLSSVLAALTNLALAGLIFRRRSRDWMALGVCFFLLLLAVDGPLEILADHHLSWTRVYSLSTALTGPILLLFLGLFPSGRLVPRWYRWLIPVIVVWGVVDPFLTLGVVDAAIWLSLMGLGIYAQSYRFRRVSSRSERQQTKWVIYGLALWLATLLVLLSLSQIAFAEEAEPNSVRWWLQGVAFSMYQLSRTIFPVALAIAILRFRLYEIDLIIRRTLQYTLLTALLALVYFGGVVLLQRILGPLTGQANSPLVIVISTLLIAALFSPLRRRVQVFIDRRFYRQKYDAEKALARFAAAARDEVDMDRLAAALLGVVDETMQPEQVKIWLKQVN